MDPTRATAERVGSVAVRAFVVLLLVNALVAIAAIVGAAGEDQWRVVGTTLLLTAACLVVAANAAAIERRALRVVPWVGAAAGTLAIAGFIVAIWVRDVDDREEFWKPILVLLVLGAAGTYASLLALPPLWHNWGSARWSGWAAASVLALVTIVAIVVEEGPAGEFYAVVSVVLATATMLVLIGALAVRRSRQSSVTSVAGDEAGLWCPRCRGVVATHIVPGTHVCPSCGQGFSVDPNG